MSPNTHFKRPFEFNEDLWFDDGDMCVCARRFDSGALCLYKLYRDILAVHSTILLNLLDTSIVRGEVYVGDTPYAYLADYDALDLERFFVAIYYPTYFLFWKHDARSFSRTLPVFKIAAKYKAHSVIRALASQLEEDWPQTIEEWDASQCESEDGSFSEPSSDDRRDSMGMLSNRAVIEPASAIRVAHMANIPQILPAAYYQLSKTITSSSSHAVSTLGPKQDRKEHKKGRKHNHRGQTLLSNDDVRCLAAGRERLSRYMVDFRKRASKELAFHPRCGDAWDASRGSEESVDVLTDLLDVCGATMFPGAHMCTECRSKVNERGRKERERVWELLPKLFSLPQPRTSGYRV